MHLVDKLDIPFIAMYRKEICPSLLKDPVHIELGQLKRHKVLWAIQELHVKWQSLQEKKRASLYHYFYHESSRYLSDYDALTSPPAWHAYPLMCALQASKSETEVDDVDTKFRLYFPAEIRPDGFRPHKRLKRDESFYSNCRKVKARLITGTGAIRPFKIVFGDESLGRLYEKSQASSIQLPGQSGTVKRAVALGRYLQNPPAMAATLCGPEREILSWKLLDSPFEDVLTPDEKYKMIEQVMVDVTNQVGLDINLAINHQWLFAPLQFISGLGPRKAAYLQQLLVASGCALSERREFVTLHHLGEKVYDNAVGFLRVRPSSSSSNRFPELLNDTRIHPESYILAQELVNEVYNDKDALQCIRDRPGYLLTLDIEAYARSKQLEDKVQTLCDIRKELIQGFQDPRKEWEAPSGDEVFHLATGFTDDTICEGRTVQARVYSVSFSNANCVTEVGLVGTLRRHDYSDDARRCKGLNKKLKKGDVITCKIKTVKKRFFPFEIVLGYDAFPQQIQ